MVNSTIDNLLIRVYINKCNGLLDSGNESNIAFNILRNISCMLDKNVKLSNKNPFKNILIQLTKQTP